MKPYWLTMTMRISAFHRQLNVTRDIVTHRVTISLSRIINIEEYGHIKTAQFFQGVAYKNCEEIVKTDILKI